MLRKFNPNLLKIILSIVIILLTFIFVSYPLFHDGFFPTFDDVQVVRIDEMVKELLHGQFPVRYSNNLGNGGGYFLFNFYSPFVYYLGAAIHIVGFSLVKSTKIIFILGYLLGGLSMFVVLRKVTNLLSSVLGAVLFLFSTYFSYEVYTRGTLAEFFAMSMLPLFFGLTLRLKERASVNLSIIYGVVFGLLIFTHIFISVNALLLFLIIYLFPPYKLKQFILGGTALLIGGLLSASFWLPMFFEQAYTQYSASYFGLNSYNTNLLSPPQLLGFQNIPWGFTPPVLGLPISIGIIITIIGFLMMRKKNKLILGCLAAFLISLFLASDLSRPIWNSFSFLKMLQFPWRFLAGATVAAVFAISLFMDQLKKWPAILTSVIIIFTVLSNISYFRPSTYNYIAVYTADDACSTTTWTQEYFPKWTRVCLPKPKNKPASNVTIDGGKSSVNLLNEKKYGRLISFSTNLKKDSDVVVRRYYFPGWKVFMDDKQVNIKPHGEEGLISFIVPSGQHKVRVELVGTEIQKMGNWISLIAFFAILAVVIFRVKPRKLL